MPATECITFNKSQLLLRSPYFFRLSWLWSIDDMILDFMSCIGSSDSSVSKNRWSSGIILAVWGLKRSPRDMAIPLSISCDASCGLPRNPCTIHSWRGWYSRCMCRSRSNARTQCMIIGLRSCSLSSMWCANNCSCRLMSAPRNLSSPHSPMAVILVETAVFSSAAMRSSASGSTVCQGCSPLLRKAGAGGSGSPALTDSMAQSPHCRLWVCISVMVSGKGFMAQGHIRCRPRDGNAGCVSRQGKCL